MTTANLRPVGMLVAYDFPPDTHSNGHCSLHAHRWTYRVKGHRLASDMFGRSYMAEVLEPVQESCLIEEANP